MREFSDYGFLVVAGEDFIQRSPLSEYPVDSPIPGAKSYFQVDADGNLTTPLIPAEHTRGNAFGVSSVEYTQRLALQNEILQLFSQPRLEEVREPEEQDSDKLALSAKTSLSETRLPFAV